MRRKGFTLVELLVVIAIIALLMGILMPALARVRQLAYRMVCGTNLSGIGKSMIVYANDYEEEYPVAGGRGPTWTTLAGARLDGDNFDKPSPIRAYGRPPGAAVTVGSCFYLLVKYSGLGVKPFICKGDTGSKLFKLSDYTTGGTPRIEDYEDGWDFGSNPGTHYSYSYHYPFTFTDAAGSSQNYAVNTLSNPSLPVCADRSPYFDKAAGDPTSTGDGWVDGDDPEETEPIWEPATATSAGYLYDADRTMNSASHQRDGQNILFVDSHVDFEDKPNVGLEDDNIYKAWSNASPTPEEMQMGTLIKGGSNNGDGFPMDKKDSYLINDRNDGY